MIPRSTKPKIDRKTARAAVEIMQRGHCAYRSERCDCKFGVAELGRTQASEHGSGCPELRVVALVIAGLTDAQYAAAFARGREVLEAERLPRDFVDGPSSRLTVEACNFSVRTSNALYGAGIRLLGHLAAFSPVELLKLKHFGRRSGHEVKVELAKRGLALRGEELNDDIVKMFRYVRDFFGGDEEKAQLWFSTANPLLGGLVPDSLLMLKPGRLLKTIQNQLSENNR